jgi:hypothetical protein
MFAFAYALLLAPGCNGAAVPTMPVEPIGYVVRGEALMRTFRRT